MWARKIGPHTTAIDATEGKRIAMGGLGRGMRRELGASLFVCRLVRMHSAQKLLKLTVHVVNRFRPDQPKKNEKRDDDASMKPFKERLKRSNEAGPDTGVFLASTVFFSLNKKETMFWWELVSCVSLCRLSTMHTRSSPLLFSFSFSLCVYPSSLLARFGWLVGWSGAPPTKTQKRKGGGIHFGCLSDASVSLSPSRTEARFVIGWWCLFSEFVVPFLTYAHLFAPALHPLSPPSTNRSDAARDDDAVMSCACSLSSPVSPVPLSRMETTISIKANESSVPSPFFPHLSSLAPNASPRPLATCAFSSSERSNKHETHKTHAM